MSPETRRIAIVIAAEIGAKPEQVATAIELLDGGATVPFVARYRKEVTGGLDDAQLRTLSERLIYLREMDTRRKAIVESIASQGKLTDEIAAKLNAAGTKAELEDIYLPFKPKRRTRAEIARERGLGPLADSILADRTIVPAERAAAFITEDVPDVRAALEGARDILSEAFAENADLVGRLRTYMQQKATFRARVVEGKEEAGAKFADYFDHVESWASMPSHRALAMMRGSDEEILSLGIEIDADDPSPVKPVERTIAAVNQIDPASPAGPWLMEVVRWTW